MLTVCGGRTIAALPDTDVGRSRGVPDGVAPPGGGADRGRGAGVWLYATARRVLANQRRSSRRRAALYERLAVDAAVAQPQPLATSREEALVHEALRRLGQH